MNEVEMLQQAQLAIKQGDIVTGKQLLKQILRENPQNDTAWLMATAITEYSEASIKYLNQAIEIDPTLQHLEGKKEKRLEEDGYAGMGKQDNLIVSFATFKKVMIFGVLVIISLLAVNGYLFQMRASSSEEPSEEMIDDELMLVDIDNLQTEEQTLNEQDEVEIETSGIIIDTLVAGGGKYVILRMQSIPGLAIYDTAEKKIVNTIRLASDNFLYAAGGNILLIYFPENNLLQTWDIETLEKLKTKANPKGPIITRITMGHNNDSRAFVRYASGTDALDRAGAYVLDIITLQEIPFELSGERTTIHNGVYRDFVHQRTDGSMHLISEWATSHTPTGLGAFVLSNDSWTTAYEHKSAGYVAVGDDGLVYTQSGDIYSSQLIKIGNISGEKLIPGIGGSLFLGIANDGSMQVYASGTTTPMGPVGNFPGLESRDDYQAMSGGWAKTPYVFDRHIIFNPIHGYIILIPPENNRIIQRSFDLVQLLEQAGVDYIVVTSIPDMSVASGESWEYQIEALSNDEHIQYSLEFGPEDMRVGDGGLVSWQVPIDYGGSSEKVTVLVENGNNDSTYHNFELQIKPLPSP